MFTFNMFSVYIGIIFVGRDTLDQENVLTCILVYKMVNFEKLMEISKKVSMLKAEEKYF